MCFLLVLQLFWLPSLIINGIYLGKVFLYKCNNETLKNRTNYILFLQ